MIGSLVSRISGLLGKEYLFGSFLPSLIFFGILGASLAFALGVGPVWTWIDGWTPLQKTTATAVSGLVIVVFAYALSGLRAASLVFWSGMMCEPFLRSGKNFQHQGFERLRKRAMESGRWSDLESWFRKGCGPYWTKQHPVASVEDIEEFVERIEEVHQTNNRKGTVKEVKKLLLDSFGKFVRSSLEEFEAAFRAKVETWPQDLKEETNTLIENAEGPLGELTSDAETACHKCIRSLDFSMSRSDVEASLQSEIIEMFRIYDGESLTDVYNHVIRLCQDWNQKEQAILASNRARLDRRFGSIASIRATRLGNVVEAYKAYAYKRYRIEGDVFWPHLQHVVPDEFRVRLDDTRIMLDFALTMATLSVAYAMLAIFVGPWLTASMPFWITVFGVGLLLAYLFYRLAVFLAEQFGDLVRAAYDLFRLRLLEKFGRTWPQTLEQEREKWSQLSRLVVYGFEADASLDEALADAVDFELTKPE